MFKNRNDMKIFCIRVKTIALVLMYVLFCACQESAQDKEYVLYVVDPYVNQVSMHWKTEKGEAIRTLGRLKEELEIKQQKLLFAMNGGMFEQDYAPKGLYIEDFKQLRALDTLQGAGNFYLQPNGVFYLTKNKTAHIVKTTEFKDTESIQFATQSGPLLVIDNQLNKQFTPNSTNLNIRNGVGVKANGEIVFAMSKDQVNFYTFAQLFKNLGCKNALYLDGFVSRAYLPSKNWSQLEGDFGVIIGVSESH